MKKFLKDIIRPTYLKATFLIIMIYLFLMVTTP